MTDPIDRYAGQTITPALLRAEADRLDDTPATGQASWAMGETAALLRLAADRLGDRSHEQLCDDGECENSEAVVAALLESGLWDEVDGDGTNASILADHVRQLDHMRRDAEAGR